VTEQIELPVDDRVSAEAAEARCDAGLGPNWVVNASVLLRHRRFLGRAGAIALLANIVIAFLIPLRYQSTARIMPPETSASGTALLGALAGRALGGDVLGGIAASLMGGHNTGFLFINLLQSDTVTSHLVDRFHLQSVYHKRYRVDACKALIRRTRIEQDKKSGVITITVTDASPQRARDMVQAYLDELNLMVNRTNTSSAHRERVFIENRLAAVRGELDKAQEALSNFSSTHMTVDLREQTRATVDAAAKLQGELIATKGELTSLREIYGDDNIRLRTAQARAANLKSELAKLGGTSAALSKSSEDDTDSNYAQETSGDLSYPPLRQLPRLAVPYENLYRNARVQETVFELLTQQYEIAQIQEAKDIPVLSVIDSPGIPDKKSFPPRTLLILVLTIVELLAIAMFILVRFYWRAIDPADPRRKIAAEASDAIKHGLRRMYGYIRSPA
jgi:capsule polysaccharide export protein KpsE/RkpR